jgi:hypothetical protein
MLNEQDLSNRKVYDSNGYCIYSNQSAYIVGENIACSRNVDFQSRNMKRKNVFLSDDEELRENDERKYLKLI